MSILFELNLQAKKMTKRKIRKTKKRVFLTPSFIDFHFLNFTFAEKGDDGDFDFAGYVDFFSLCKLDICLLLTIFSVASRRRYEVLN